QDLVGHDLRVFADAVEDRRLGLPEPVHSHEVESRDGGGSVGLDRKAHLIEDGNLDPAVLGSIAAGPDDGADAVSRDIQRRAGLDPHRRRNLILRPSHPGLRAQRVDESTYLGPTRIAEIDAYSEVVGEMNRRALGAGKTPKQLDALRMKRAEMQIVTPTVSGRLRIPDQTSRRSRQFVGRAIHEARLDQPPHQVVAVEPAWDPGAAPAGKEYLSAGFVQLLGDLASGLTAAYDENVSGRQGSPVAIVPAEHLVNAARHRVGPRWAPGERALGAGRPPPAGVPSGRPPTRPRPSRPASVDPPRSTRICHPDRRRGWKRGSLPGPEV